MARKRSFLKRTQTWPTGGFSFVEAIQALISFSIGWQVCVHIEQRLLLTGRRSMELHMRWSGNFYRHFNSPSMKVKYLRQR